MDGEKWELLNQKTNNKEKLANHGQDNPEIIDDWPLHPVGDISTRTTIGACWQGKYYRFSYNIILII